MENTDRIRRVPRMRYQEAALAQLKAEDPETPITAYMLKRLLSTGAIPSIKVGRRRLFNYDDLLDYLQKAPVGASYDDRAAAPGGIRMVAP